MIGEYYYDLYQLIEASLGKKITADQVDQIHKIYKTIGGEMDEAEILAAFFDKKYTMTNSSHIRIDFSVAQQHSGNIPTFKENNIYLTHV